MTSPKHNWFYAQDGKPVGPVSVHEIRDLPGETPVWAEGFADWVSRVNVEHLMPRTLDILESMDGQSATLSTASLSEGPEDYGAIVVDVMNESPTPPLPAAGIPAVEPPVSAPGVGSIPAASGVNLIEIFEHPAEVKPASPAPSVGNVAGINGVTSGVTAVGPAGIGGVELPNKPVEGITEEERRLLDSPFIHLRRPDLEDEVPKKAVVTPKLSMPAAPRPALRPAAEMEKNPVVDPYRRNLHKSVSGAGFGVRLLATGIDGGLLGGMITLMVNSLEQNMAFLLILALITGYNIAFVALLGGTPGKLMLNLKVVDLDGGRVEWLTAVSRFCVQVIHGPFLGVGYFMILLSEEQRALHDKVCRTQVIYSKV